MLTHDQITEWLDSNPLTITSTQIWDADRQCWVDATEQDRTEEWLDDMAQISGTHIWDADQQRWVWEETGEPVNQVPTDTPK